MRVARKLALTTKEYVWIATQPVIGADLAAPTDFPPGMLGVHFDTDTKASGAWSGSEHWACLILGFQAKAKKLFYHKNNGPLST